MECVLLIGIQASGKTTFYKQNLFNSHMRINLDMLKTRHRERIFVEASLLAKQPFVIDNTNPTAASREGYIAQAREHRFRVVGYYFEPDYAASVQRNERREGKAQVPLIGIKSVLKQLEPPAYSEGFDALYRVSALEGGFEVEAIEPVAEP